MKIADMAADVTDTDQMEHVFDAAEPSDAIRDAAYRAGRGAPVRVVDKNEEAGSFEPFEAIVGLNLNGETIRLGGIRRTAPG